VILGCARCTPGGSSTLRSGPKCIKASIKTIGLEDDTLEMFSLPSVVELYTRNSPPKPDLQWCRRAAGVLQVGGGEPPQSMPELGQTEAALSRIAGAALFPRARPLTRGLSTAMLHVAQSKKRDEGNGPAGSEYTPSHCSGQHGTTEMKTPRRYGGGGTEHRGWRTKWTACGGRGGDAVLSSMAVALVFLLLLVCRADRKNCFRLEGLLTSCPWRHGDAKLVPPADSTSGMSPR
jgi:hypothetical protein